MSTFCRVKISRCELIIFSHEIMPFSHFIVLLYIIYVLKMSDFCRFLVEIMLRQESLTCSSDYLDDNLKLAGPVPKAKKSCNC